MKDRKPYDLKNVILGYNAVQVLMSIFLVREVTKYLLTFKIVFNSSFIFDRLIMVDGSMGIALVASLSTGRTMSKLLG